MPTGHQGKGARLREDGAWKDFLLAATVYDGEKRRARYTPCYPAGVAQT